MPIYQVENLKQKFKDFLHREFSSYLKLNQAPLFSIVLVGDDFSSLKYIEMKLKLASELGVKNEFLHFSNDVEISDIRKKIQKYQNQKVGIIFQIPIKSDLIPLINELEPTQDLDLLGQRKNELLIDGFLPPTIGAIDLVLKDIYNQKPELDTQNIAEIINQDINLAGKIVAVIGQGRLVGNPLLDYLAKRNATIISINASTKDAKDLAKTADILISATGVGGLVDDGWLKKSYTENNILHPIVIDAGTSEGVIEHKNNAIKALVGDVDTEKVQNICTVVAVPGGVGPITVRYIFWNLYKLITK